MGQFSGLMIKNWILFKRTWIGSLCELLIPTMFICLIVIIKGLGVPIDYPETQFVEH